MRAFAQIDILSDAKGIPVGVDDKLKPVHACYGRKHRLPIRQNQNRRLG